MTTIRRIGAVAALGGMVAAVALLTGLPGARADDLSQLRANQQLLQQRLDQLEQQAALGAAPVPPGAPSLAGSFPRSFLIPGTNTSLQIGGYVNLDAVYFSQGASPNGSSAAAPPLEGAPVVAGTTLHQTGPGALTAPPFNARTRNRYFAMSANESRFFIETRTPTAWGQARTHLELDMFGCAGSGGITCSNLNNSTNGNVPRLRLAYGTLGPFLAGQDFGPTLFLEASPTLFDFGGDVGILGPGRGPQIRYTGQLPYGFSYIVAAYNPVTGTFTPTGALENDSAGTGISGTNTAPTGLAINPTRSRYPDGNFALRVERPWGSAQFGAVVRDLNLDDGRFINKDYIGYGAGFGVHVIPGWLGFKRDNFGFNMFGGDGLGHYTSPTGTATNTWLGLATNFGGPAVGGYGTCNANTPACLAIDSKANAARVIAKTIPSWGFEANYQHWWGFASGLRSTISGGIMHQDIPTTLIGSPDSLPNGNAINYNKELITAHVNIIWSPVAFIDTGFEYTYGHRHTIYNQTGNLSAFDYTFRVRF
ncbi:MAG TPA: DcaP family trimeric outer membrane transporter [Stellaceae bacterium]|nr:DcaP family trimeric outer membrane transporter [Stellaceae bacterium]